MTEGSETAAPDRLDRPFLDPLFERLFPPLPSGVHWGLERVRAALAELGDPHIGVPAIHVGGTNGKGSVTSLVASVLARAGHRVGLYTSPHLCSLTERFQIDGRPASPDDLIEAADRVRPAVVAHGLTFFEAATVLAFEYFRRHRVDVLSVEVGLGGRLDATNVLEPVVVGLTNVDLDHAEFLGPTREAIAGEKAGILKAGVPAVTAEVRTGPLGVFRAAAARVGARLEVMDPVKDIRDVVLGERHTSFRTSVEPWGELSLDTPLVGRHQAVNAGLAVRLLAHLPPEFRPDAEAIRNGVAGVHWPGRDQIVHREDGVWVFDVAHNTAGVGSLTGVLDRLDLPRPRSALVAVLGDKEWDQMLPPLLTRVRGAVLTQPLSAPEGRRWDPRVARGVVEEAGVATPVEVVDDFPAALARARAMAPGGTVVVTGSCYTVGDALRELGIPPYPAERAGPLPNPSTDPPSHNG